MSIKKEVTISFEWWTDDHGWTDDHDNEEIKQNHAEALEETAMEKIISMMKEGFTSGELEDNINMDDDDPEEGVGYSGWWSLKWKTA
jgi:hypothetical protein